MRKQWNSKQRFSLRKFSTGLASVLLATMFMSQGVMAQTQSETEGNVATESVKPKAEKESPARGKDAVVTEKEVAPLSGVGNVVNKKETTNNGLLEEKMPEVPIENKLNKKNLEELLKQIDQLNLKDYTEATVKVLQEKVAKAKDALVNAKSQKEINSAYNALVGYKNSGLKRVPKLEENNTPKPDTTNGKETVGKKAENTEPNGTNIAGHNHSLNGTTLSEGSGFRTETTNGLSIEVTGDTTFRPGDYLNYNSKYVHMKLKYDKNHYGEKPTFAITGTPNVGIQFEASNQYRDKKKYYNREEGYISGYLFGTIPKEMIGKYNMLIHMKYNANGVTTTLKFPIEVKPDTPTLKKPTENDGAKYSSLAATTLVGSHSEVKFEVNGQESPWIKASSGEAVYSIEQGFRPGDRVRVKAKAYSDTISVGEHRDKLNPEESESNWSSETILPNFPTPTLNKDGAKNEVNTAFTNKTNQIDQDNSLTNEEKTELKELAKTAKDNAIRNIENAQDETTLNTAKNNGVNAINGVALPAETEKAKAIKAVEQAKTTKDQEIDGNTALTTEEKDAAKAQTKQAKDDAVTNINAATTNAQVGTAKDAGIKAINDVGFPSPTIKEQANATLEEAARREKAEIKFDENPDLTDAVRNKELAEVDRVLKNELAKIDAKTTNKDVKDSVKQGVKAIEAIHKPLSSNAHEAAILRLPELDLQTALVAGTATVKQGQKLADADITNQLILSEDVKVLSVTKPSTDEAGNFVAAVELLLADGKTKEIVTVPVSIYSQTPPKVDDLSKAKEEAIEKVEKAVKDKLQEIEKQADLTEAERKAAKNEVNKAKDSAWKAIAQASSLGTVELLGEESANNIAAFTPVHGKDIPEVKAPDVAKLDEAQAKGIAAVLQAEVDKLELMKKDTTLTEIEVEEVKAEVARIKKQAIADIRREKDVTSVQTITDAAVEAILNARPRYNFTYNSNHSSTSNTNHSQSANEALLAKKSEAKMLIEKEAMKKKAEINQAELSESEKALLDARVDQEKAKAFQMIDQATTIEEVDQALKAGIEAIRSIAVASANGRMTDVTPEESEEAMAQAHRQALPQTGTGNEVAIFGAVASAILAGLGLVVPSKKKED